MEKGFRVGIVGATGYVGVELIRILSTHSRFRMTRLVSQSYAGRDFADVYPAFSHLVNLPLVKLEIDDLAENCDLVITALPHGISAAVVPELLARGIKVLDHSGDFRYQDVAVYEKTYKLSHPRPDLLAESVYGLPEIYRDEIASARLVGNPGCYPTCSLLALKPLLQSGVIKTENIIIDAVSGVSGAGRKADLAFSFCENDANFKAYGVTGHRHTSEIEEKAGFLARLQAPPAITFTPHLVPFKRGMMATVYADLLPDVDPIGLRALFQEAYAHEFFIRLMPAGMVPETKNVAYTNFADLAVFADTRTGKVKVLSAIDNLGKGAAGQAIQSLNLMAGLPETEGLIAAGAAI